jgi:hypothetical protein
MVGRLRGELDVRLSDVATRLRRWRRGAKLGGRALAADARAEAAEAAAAAVAETRLARRASPPPPPTLSLPRAPTRPTRSAPPGE